MDTTHKLFPVSRYLDCGDNRFYYPYGNTPAEDFLENVHPKLVKEPDILVLGCGDIRSCFYTLWKHFTPSCQSEQTPSFSGVHFVLNDHSAAVLARNIIFLYLCMQKFSVVHSTDFSKWLCSTWAIWFSQRLQPDHKRELDSALRDLLRYSLDTESWASRDNPLSSLVQFSSKDTLSKIHRVLKMWLTHDFNVEPDYRGRIRVSTSTKSDIENLMGMAIGANLSFDEREKMESEISSCSDGNSFAEYVISNGRVLPVKKLIANATMHERTDGRFCMHSLLPFRCFHHSFQFSSSKLQSSGVSHAVLDRLVVTDEKFQKYPLLANSVQQFALWLSCSSAFAPSSNACITFMFHCSDAVEFCNELHNSECLLQLKVKKFDAIYTSNLLDPVYPQNLVLFAIPLLKSNGYLFTTTLKYKTLAQSTHEYIANSFGVDNKMLPILFGIRCINNEGDKYRDKISIRPAPVEFNAIFPGFTPYYVKVLIWEKLPSMIIQDIPPTSSLWHSLYSTVSTILSVPPGNLNPCSSQTAVKILQTFLAHINADDSDSTFWDPLCSLLKCNQNVKHLLQALQTHSILGGLHLHLLITGKTCPICNEIPLSKYYGQICVSIRPPTQFQLILIYAQVYKSEECDSVYSTFDCLASQHDSASLKLCFIIPHYLCESGNYVRIVSFSEMPFPNVLTEGQLRLESFLSSDITYSFSKFTPCIKVAVTTFGSLKSHHGNGDTFESVILLSDSACSNYSNSKKICIKQLSPSKIELSCGMHNFVLSYPHPVDYSTLSLNVSQSQRTVSLLATRKSHHFYDEQASLFLVNPDSKLTLPHLHINNVVLGCLMGMQLNDLERSQLVSQTGRSALADLKNLINMMMQEEQIYFNIMDHSPSVYVMVLVLNRVFDYQLKVPAIDLIYCVTSDFVIVQKWSIFTAFDLAVESMHSTIELLEKVFMYFSKRTISSPHDLLESVKRNVGGCFKRAVIYPLYSDPDDMVHDNPKSSSEMPSNPEKSESKCKEGSLDTASIITSSKLTNKCSYCATQSSELKRCSNCLSVQYCSVHCQKKHWKKHKENCQYAQNVNLKKHESTSHSHCESKLDSFLLGTRCAQCFQESAKLKACSKCHTVYYCNKECQKKHWKEHKKTCCALHDCSEQTKHLDEVSMCSYCSKTSNYLKKCTLCYAVQYCDKDCQRKHWPQHKMQCKTEQAISVSSSQTLTSKTEQAPSASDSQTLTSKTEQAPSASNSQTLTSRRTNMDAKPVSKKCSFCLRKSTDLKKCTRCHKAMYCDKLCQEKHWKIHKTLCKSE